MAKAARRRETNHVKAIYRWHPQFAGQEFIKYFGDEERDYDNSTIEGGDVLVIGRGAVVGMGAVVTKNVPAGATVVGNPAKVMNK